MEGKWTFKYAYSDEWSNDLYNSKEEAYQMAKSIFQKDFSLGKLRKCRKGLKYFVEDIVNFTSDTVLFDNRWY